MPTTDMWVGAPGHDAMRVRAKVSGTSPRLVVSTSQLLANPIYVGPVVADAQGVATFDVTGLTPGTRYWCAVETSGTPDTSVMGRFRTLAGAPGTPVSYTMATWTCAGLSPRFPGHTGYVSTHPVLNTITDWIDPDFLMQGGDLHYANIATASLTAYRDAIDAVLHKTGTPNLSRQLRQVPTVYCWDDHDFGANDSDSTSPGRTQAAQVYRERVPHYPLAQPTGPIYHSFVVGRVLHIVSDVRYDRTPDGAIDNASKTMLGAAQLAWMEQLLATSDAEFLVWTMPSQWMGTSDDSWAVFSYERNIVTQMLKAPGGDPSKDWTNRMVQVSGDVHALVVESGEGNRWGGFPILVAASVDSSAGGAQSGIYKLDGRYVTTSPGRNRYGTVQIVDDGYTITCTLTGYIGKWRRARHSFSVVTGTAPESLPTGVQVVSATATVDRGNGPETVDISSFSVDREIPTTMPDKMRLVSGVSAAEANAELASPPDAGPGYHSPWRRGLARTTQWPVAIDVTINGETSRVFTGSTTDGGGSARSSTMGSSALDAMQLLDKPVAVPAFTADMGDAHPGASLMWVMEHVLQQVGMSPLPDLLADPVAVMSLAGSHYPNVGSIRSSDTNGDGTAQPTYEQLPDLPVPVASDADAWCTPYDTFLGWTGWTVGVVIGAPAHADSSNSRVKLAFINNALTLFQINLWLSPSPDRINAQIEHEGGNFADLPVGDALDYGAAWWHVSRSGDNVTASVIQHGQVVGSVAIAVPGISAADVGLYDIVIDQRNTPMLGVQVVQGLIPVADLPVWDQDTVRADLDQPVARIVGVPGLSGKTGTEILRDIADAEQGGFWFSEEGIPTFRSRASFRGLDTVPIPVTSLTNLEDFNWKETIDQLASTVKVDTTHPVAVRAAADPPEHAMDVWVADQIFSIPARKWLNLEVELSKPTGTIDTFFKYNTATGTRFQAHKNPTGSGATVTNWLSSLRYKSARLISSTRARIDIYNPNNFTVYFVDGMDGSPNLAIAATITITETDPVAVTRDTGIANAGELALPTNPWRQDINDTEALTVFLAEEATNPSPLITGVKVVPDPRIKLGTVIDLQDLHYSGINIRALVRKSNWGMDAGKLEQILEVQPLRVTLGELDAAWAGQTLGELDAYWDGKTLGDLDNAPLENTAIYMGGLGA